ncbi:hypothetical protein EV207_101138 [Scopulibacillus darangshiensis]|uniref:Uncharacterized protein n=1 Tax=Scopulibacillus darangshiensis TaxID=442528 RepID=A0A4R2PAQ2_9BACL|nr:hypothetical protein [Scopulibacillus darangshiensis]TCP32160.1 hypothetical protein EV207_101138 [Scopulibacillus darangshiensis]
MHPKTLCSDFAKMGSPIVLDGDDLYIENPENIYHELERLAKSYKRRIIKHLQGDYSIKDHALYQTIDKIVDYMSGCSNKAINDWLYKDYESVDKIMTLLKMFYENGWKKFDEPVVNFETPGTDRLSQEIFDRAMSHFKGA